MKKKEPKQENPQEPVTECPQQAPDEESAQGEQSAVTLLELLNKAEAERDQAREELQQTREKQDEYLQMAQRVQAEFDNYRRRNQSLYQDAYAEGTRDAVGKFIAVLDNLERAAQAQGDGEAVRSGVEMVLKQFLGVMQAMGVEEIPAEGEAFDPNMHNAVMQEMTEDGETGRVLQVLQKGYRIKDKVLRYSMVKVSG